MHNVISEAACGCPFDEGERDLERPPLMLLLLIELRMVNGDGLVDFSVSEPSPEALRKFQR